MKQNDINKKNLKCVVLCAGKGKRIRPYSYHYPKVMIDINKKPILHYVIDYWKKYTNDFIFVVGYKKEQIINYVRKLSINAEFVEQKELKGIADALTYVKNYISNDMIVVLGDCLYYGDFKFPDDLELGIGIQETNNLDKIKLNYSVDIKNNIVQKVVEKPKEVFNNLCGMGFYVFNDGVFKYIKKTPPSSLRNEVEITDVIQNMIDNGEKIKPIMFYGDYMNITFPEDVNKAEKIINK